MHIMLRHCDCVVRMLSFVIIKLEEQHGGLWRSRNDFGQFSGNLKTILFERREYHV